MRLPGALAPRQWSREGRAIYAAPPGRRPLAQARRLVPQRKPLRRYLGPILVAGVGLGMLADLAFGTRPAPAPAAPVAPAAAVELSVQVAEAIPLAEAEAPPQAAAAPPQDPRVVAQLRLREAVFAPFRGLGGIFGIAVKDLGSGMTVYHNETFPFQAASLFKLPVMYEVFKARESGLLTFREELTIGPEDAAMDLGSLAWPVGTRITVGTALERMITLSDNSSAFMLIRRVGTWRVNEDALELGMNQTYIRGDDLSTSALDMLRLLESIATGQAVDADSSAEMVQLMARQQVRNRIPALLPPEVTVANKTGNWEAAVHDVAIVYTPRATLAIVFLSDRVTDADAVNDAMGLAALNLYYLLSDPIFATRPSPPLPSMSTAGYAAAPRPPAAPYVAPTRPPAPAAGLAPTVSTAPVQRPPGPVAAPANGQPVLPTPASAPSEHVTRRDTSALGSTEPAATPPTNGAASQQSVAASAPPVTPTAAPEATRAARPGSRAGPSATPVPAPAAPTTKPNEAPLFAPGTPRPP